MIALGTQFKSDFEWKDIKGFEGFYSINKVGEVLSKHNNGKILKPINHSGGYLYVNLYSPNLKRRALIHRLVMETFEPTDNLSLEVNHKNGNKRDNSFGNLEWVTSYENIQHARENDLFKHVTPVNQYTLDGRLINSFTSISKASESTGVGYSVIRGAVRGVLKSAGGFLWRRDTGDDSNLIIKEFISGTKNNERPILQLSKQGKLLSRYKSIAEASARTGIGYSAIAKCVSGANKTSGGFRWEYEIVGGK